jgi:hypothetical protein
MKQLTPISDEDILNSTSVYERNIKISEDYQEFISHVINDTDLPITEWSWYNEDHKEIVLASTDIIDLTFGYIQIKSLFKIMEDGSINTQIMIPNAELQKLFQMTEDEEITNDTFYTFVKRSRERCTMCA